MDKSGIFEAVKNRNIEYFINLPKNSKELNARDNQGNTPLMYALETVDKIWNKFGRTSEDKIIAIKLSKILIRKGCDINIQNDFNRTALHLAVRGDMAEIVKLLIEKGADIEAKDINEETPLIWTTGSQLKIAKLLIEQGAHIYEISLERAIMLNNEQHVKLLLENGVNLKDEYYGNPLHRAVQNGSRKIVRLLLENNADINAPNRKGFTPIEFSIKAGRIDIAMLLINTGCELNFSNKTSALHLAAEKGYTELTKKLIEKGANLNAVDRTGKTPLIRSVITSKIETVTLLINGGCDVNIQDGNKHTALNYVGNGKYSNIKICRLLIDSGAELKKEDRNNQTVIHFAVNGHDRDIVELLIESGADLNKVDCCDRTPLMFAAKYRSIEIIELLIKNGAEINIADIDGRTPLMWAVENSNTRIVQQLIKFGAKVNSVDQDGKSSLILAVIKENYDTANILIPNGSNINIVDNLNKTALSYCVTSIEKESSPDSYGERTRYEVFRFSYLTELLLNSGADPNTGESILKNIFPLKEHLKTFHKLILHGLRLNNTILSKLLNEDNKYMDLVYFTGSCTPTQLLDFLHQPSVMNRINASPVKKKWYDDRIRFPMTLKDISRRTVFMNLRPSKLRNVDFLQIPKPLKDMLRFVEFGDENK